jgi:zinc finger FYVE domain-containing protein 26
LYSSSYSTTSPLLRARKSDARSAIDSPQKQDQSDTPTIPIVSDEVHYQLTGTANDDALRNDFHYDQSPSISLCLSIIELHSNQYQGGKLLIKLCEYLSEQLSTKERNTEIDYGLVLNIIKNLLFTAKMKLMTTVLDEEQLSEQQKLIASSDMYNNLIDILNRLNMANCSLPALNDLLQSDTLRKLRNQLLDDERYQLAMDISTKCNLDTQTIWFQWGMGKKFIFILLSKYLYSN